MGPISLSVILPWAGKDYHGQTIQLALPIHKLQIKWSVENTTPGTIFATLHSLRNLWMNPISLSVTLHWAGKDCHGQTI